MNHSSVLIQNVDAGLAHLDRSPGEFPRKTNLPTPRTLPDPSICRAKAIGLIDYGEGLMDCLVERPFHCPHALRFGLGVYCRHPQRDEIAARTAAHLE